MTKPNPTTDTQPPQTEEVADDVRRALAEDVGPGDLTALLIDENSTSTARIVANESGIFCGRAWLEETYKQLGGLDSIEWKINEGQPFQAKQEVVLLQGNSRKILTGERTALNFIQFLSGVATKAHSYSQLTTDMPISILDTRKTIPGLRKAQKYAVRCGGAVNHRMGLYDAFLIKENHIKACSGIKAAIHKARSIAPNKTLEIEVENLEELGEAISAGADIIMLDNFSMEALENVRKTANCKFEISGNIQASDIRSLSKLNIDFISSGDLTKNVSAIDFSMRIID